MTSNFDSWEKDPFFPAAEEVQDSADRMESVYRKWIHDRKAGDSEELRTELHTVLGTAKWQLEDFQKAVESCSAKEARVRHQQFVVAIDNLISRAENSLKDRTLTEGNTEVPWVKLNEGERDELALFLTGSLPYGSSRKDEEEGSSGHSPAEKNPDSGKNSFHSVDLGPQEPREERDGHRRTVSASADFGSWNIAIADAEQTHRPPPRIPSLSCLMRTAESSSKLKWAKNGFRKWKVSDRLQAAESEVLQSLQPSEDTNACCERGKSCCLDSYNDESYNKQLHGWLGSVQRQIQRSQYQIQYSRPTQMTFWIVLVVFLIVLAGSWVQELQIDGFSLSGIVWHCVLADCMVLCLKMFFLCCVQFKGVADSFFEGRRVAASFMWLLTEASAIFLAKFYLRDKKPISVL